MIDPEVIVLSPKCTECLDTGERSGVERYNGMPDYYHFGFCSCYKGQELDFNESLDKILDVTPEPTVEPLVELL